MDCFSEPMDTNFTSSCETQDDMERPTLPVSLNLPENFVPGENDVILGRGRKTFQHIGNERFRKLVESRLEEYSNSLTKIAKSGILSQIVQEVRRRSPHGGFVKKDTTTGRWYEVGDFLAREKTSQAFRDVLFDRYKSSNTAKKIRRAEQASHVSNNASYSSMVYDGNSSLSNLSQHQNFSFNLNEPSPDSLSSYLDKELANRSSGMDSLQQLPNASHIRSATSVMEIPFQVGQGLKSSIPMDHAQLSRGLHQLPNDTYPQWARQSCPDLGSGQSSAFQLYDQPSPTPLRSASGTNDSMFASHNLAYALQQVQLQQTMQQLQQHNSATMGMDWGHQSCPTTFDYQQQAMNSTDPEVRELFWQSMR